MTNVRFPAIVSEFLNANPAYMNGRDTMGLPADQSYFHQRVLSDWEQLRHHLAEHAATILDIGCGIGGIALLLHRHYRQTMLTLVDKTDRRQPEGTFDVLEAARQFLRTNGVPVHDIETIGVETPDLFHQLEQRSYDLIVSLRALGYVFPYDLYADILRRILRPGGRLILDLHVLADDSMGNWDPFIQERFREAGCPSAQQIIARLEQDFGPVVEISRTKSYQRICVHRR